MTSNEDTWFNGENERDDEDRPPERDVVELTEELYKDIFFNPAKPNNVTWVFAVLSPHQREQFWYSDVTMMTFRVLAELMEGKVRFAWIDRNSEAYKPMQMIYGWNVYPIPFFITPDGKGGHLVEELRYVSSNFNSIGGFPCFLLLPTPHPGAHIVDPHGPKYHICKFDLI